MLCYQLLDPLESKFLFPIIHNFSQPVRQENRDVTA
jgi:hypothetical protein